MGSQLCSAALLGPTANHVWQEGQINLIFVVEVNFASQDLLVHFLQVSNLLVVVWVTPLNLNKVIDRFKTLLKKAGLPAIRFHHVRHSAATILLSMGIHPKVVQELLGHNQIYLQPRNANYAKGRHEQAE